MSKIVVPVPRLLPSPLITQAVALDLQSSDVRLAQRELRASLLDALDALHDGLHPSAVRVTRPDALVERAVDSVVQLEVVLNALSTSEEQAALSLVTGTSPIRFLPYQHELSAVPRIGNLVPIIALRDGGLVVERQPWPAPGLRHPSIVLTLAPGWAVPRSKGRKAS